MPPRKPKRPIKSLTVKLDAALVDEIREFVRRERGRPLWLEGLSSFAAQAFRREMERLALVVSGALPLDRATGRDAPGDQEPPGGGGGRDPARRPVNATKH
jgi:hypothetical protein